MIVWNLTALGPRSLLTSDRRTEGTALETYACLYVIRGEPYLSGTCLQLTEPEMAVGRASHDYTPDFAFTNAFISRRHLVIRKEGERAVLYDLHSRHGTELNGVRVEPEHPYPLNPMDTIALAKDMTILQFSYMFADRTMELEPLRLHEIREMPSHSPQIYWERRECIVDGKRIAMSEKEFLLIKLLYNHQGRLVPMAEIKRGVWPERLLGEGGVPDVSMDELNALVYRIRKKYGKETFQISAIRGGGYVLELHP